MSLFDSLNIPMDTLTKSKIVGGTTAMWWALQIHWAWLLIAGNGAGRHQGHNEEQMRPALTAISKKNKILRSSLMRVTDSVARIRDREVRVNSAWTVHASNHVWAIAWQGTI